MTEKTIISHHGLEVKITDEANEDILNILNHAVQGAEGGLRFALQHVDRRIKGYNRQIRFISLYKKNKITGTVGAIFRISGQGQLRYPTSYIRYLAFQSVYQSGIDWKRQEKSVIRTEQDDDSFKKRTLDLFSRPHMLDLPDVFEQDKHVMYAFIESMNERSKNLVHQAGYEYIRSFLTVAFSRFSPKTGMRVSKLIPAEMERMRTILLEYYRDHSFFNIDYSFTGTYYVLKEGDEIIAGVNAIPGSYKVYDVPGVWGWVIMNVLPKMPWFGRLFSPGEFRYLIFDSIYVKPGKESCLAELFESSCAIEGYNTGLTWVDDRSDFYDKLRTEVRLGAFNRMLNAKPGLVYARFINMTEEEKEPFYNSPVYVSGFDFS